jgi:hypothetical protein
VKKPFEEKADHIKELINSNKRYYPVDRRGNIDEWGAIIKQQLENLSLAEEEKKV